jgi:hypothetical protein
VTAAQADSTLLPQNVQITKMAPAGKGVVTLVLEWDRPPGVTGGVTTYQLGRSCPQYTVVAPDEYVGRASGSTFMKGPGPHHRVEAVCVCDRGWVKFDVRVNIVRAPMAQVRKECPT